jgi:glycine hydroxymethyltransferase
MILSKADYAKEIDKVTFPGMQGGPLVHIIAAKAVCFREAMQPAFKDYARQVVANARALAQTLMEEGFHITSGGTDTHLMLVNVFAKGMLGSEAENALHEAGITVNKNAIPFDTNPPLKPSGIRLGTPALTTRGFGADDFDRVADLVVEVLKNTQPAAGPNGPSKAKYTVADGTAERVRAASAELLDANPLYPGLTL